MTPAFEQLQNLLKKLPGLGYRSAERLALHLLVERPRDLPPLVEALQKASQQIGACGRCGNLAEGELCSICADVRRQPGQLCIVEQVTDLAAIERASAYRGLYHVLHGKLSPIKDIKPEDLNITALRKRLADEPVEEIILALSNDVEGEATCHYLQEEIFNHYDLKVSRIGFGLPSGGGLPYADSNTLKSALEGRREFH